MTLHKLTLMPKDELQRILGMTIINTLYSTQKQLLKIPSAWVWMEKQTKTFNKIKMVISSSGVLSGFNQNKPIVIQTDASQSGIGCCLLQSTKPIAFPSR